MRKKRRAGMGRRGSSPSGGPPIFALIPFGFTQIDHLHNFFMAFP